MGMVDKENGRYVLVLEMVENAVELGDLVKAFYEGKDI
jgi:hypothetical protein